MMLQKLISKVEKARMLVAGSIILLLLIENILVGVCVAAMQNMYIEERTLELDRGKIVLTIQHETDPTSLPDTTGTIDCFRTLYQNLTTDNRYTYYEIYTQPLYLASGVVLQSVQISKNVCSDFNLNTVAGRLFDSLDFVWEKEDVIPVLMGSSFQSNYMIGDIFSAEYLFQTFSFQVIGFLTPGSDIIRSNGTILLDECVVMPSFEPCAQPNTSEEYLNQKIHWANRTSGKLYIEPEDYDSVSNSIKELLNSAGVGEYSCYSSVEDGTFWIGLPLHTVAYTSAFFAILVSIGTLVLFRQTHCHLFQFFVSLMIGYPCGMTISLLMVSDYPNWISGFCMGFFIGITELLLAGMLTARQQYTEIKGK